MYYAVTSTGLLKDCTKVVQKKEDRLLYGYNKATGEWELDLSLCGIYTGDIECIPITKEQAHKIIKG